MQRKTRVLLRAAKYLEQEANEYIAFGLEELEESEYCGLRARILMGIAHSVRTIAMTGYAPSYKDQIGAGNSIAATSKALLKRRKALLKRSGR